MITGLSHNSQCKNRCVCVCTCACAQNWQWRWWADCRDIGRDGREQVTFSYIHIHTDTHTHTHTHTHVACTHDLSAYNLVATLAFTTTMGPLPAVTTTCTGNSTVGTGHCLGTLHDVCLPWSLTLLQLARGYVVMGVTPNE